jgi:phosphoglycolate phosphatase-like HAD superfamily hydrolase
MPSLRLSKNSWLIFDVDGVLIDAAESYDKATKLTVEHYLKEDGIIANVPYKLIRRLRKKGSFADDFRLSEALIIAFMGGEDLAKFVDEFPIGKGIEYVRDKYGVRVDFRKIVRIFNTYYLGRLYDEALFEFEGLWKRERPFVDRNLLETAKGKYKLGVITGRNALELELAYRIIDFRFSKAVTREMARKPEPRALELIVRKGEGGIYVGDTANDELLIKNYNRKNGTNFGFIMVGRDVKDVNEVLKSSIRS